MRTEARRRIAEDLAGADFAAFAARTGRIGGQSEQRAVGIVPDDVAAALGSDARVVRLSSYTAVKQRAHRRGQQFTATDYQRVQPMLDEGLILEESPGRLQVFKQEAGQIWRAVVKVTEDRREIYLQSLHRSTTTQMGRRARKLKTLRREEQ
ncbi:MAG: hypothetical protein GKR94_21825 [Gammaproteobacteria bacterium]|nr:hypothetical protein [Gammaproteobacteria bacterium]